MMENELDPIAGMPVTALAHLEWGAMCEHLVQRLASPAAKQRVRDADGAIIGDLALPRTSDVEVVEQRLRSLLGLEICLREASTIADARVSIFGELSDVEDIVDVLQRAQRGTVLDVFELAGVVVAVTAASRVGSMIAAVARADLDRLPEDDQSAFASFAEHMVMLSPPHELADMLARSLTFESGEPQLSDSASPSLGKLRKKAVAAKQSLIRSAERMVRRAGMEKALSDRYWTERDGRIVLPVRSDAFSRGGRSGTVAGIIHGSSSSGQTLFVEPHELIDGSNAVREAQMEVRAEERRILTRISREIGEVAEALIASFHMLVDLDFEHARLNLCQDLEAKAPYVERATPGAMLRLPAARHPLMMLSGVDVVPSDIEIGVGRGLVVSGVNAGGKTVALKTLGLCVLMAQAGLRVPTGQPGHVPLFRQIVTDVGDDQSIAANLSTFSAHIGHVMDALEAADVDPGAVLVLLDEVAVGTDPDQGAALAEAILQALVDRGASAVVTTHYERLKLLATHDDRFTNASVGFDLERLRPTFTLRIGAPGSSSAIAVARRLGLPEVILTHAESLLAENQVRMDVLLQQIEAERERLREEAEGLKNAQRAVKLARAELERREAREETSAAVQRQKAHQTATAALRSLEDELKRRHKSLRKSEVAVDEHGVRDGETRAAARDAKTKIREQRLPQVPIQTPVSDALAVGDRVRVPSLGSEGNVVELRGDKVTVQLPLAKVTVGRGDLEAIVKVAKIRPKATKPVWVPAPSVAGQYFGDDAKRVEMRVDNVIDLRGTRAEDALSMVEVFLDRAIADDTEVVIVRHGHGSGALRRAVREHLPRLQYVHRHRPGLPAEGGDAVTVIWVRA